MVPALLGLKGNLEMTLAARLSTALNVGSLTPAKRWKIIGANLALTQAQAVVVGFLASVFAVLIGFIGHKTIDWGHALLLCGAASATTALASSLLGELKWKRLLFGGFQSKLSLFIYGSLGGFYDQVIPFSAHIFKFSFHCYSGCCSGDSFS